MDMTEKKRKLKVLHTTTRLVLGGGVEKNIYHTIQNLQDEFEFHLSCGAECHDDLFKQLPQLRLIICNHLVNTIHPLKDLKALWFYYRLIKKEKYDIVHTHETKASFITKLAAWLAGCPYIIYGLHGVTFNDPMSRLKRKFYIGLEKLTIGCANLVVSVGQNTIDAYHQEKIGLKIPYTIIRSGIDTQAYLRETLQSETERQAFRQKLSIAPNDIILINVGRFSFSKAQRYAIEAFSVLQQKHPQLKMLLVGEGELLEECRKLSVRLNIPSSSIQFLGYRKDIPALLSASDIFLFTSLREGLPRVLVEASLLQLPIATFDVEGAAEIIENGKTGFISPALDIEKLIFNTEQLILSPEVRMHFGQSSRLRVIQEWDMHRMADRIRETYNNINCT